MCRKDASVEDDGKAMNDTEARDGLFGGVVLHGQGRFRARWQYAGQLEEERVSR